ncbi:UDP-glucose 4-epimerase GalE [Streptococcus sp. DD12]|uniref:UDP-glucose 4-epimerase GalE n=1 Tax=Streptococcus sp. DD12 TaxID=1777880 RepID=UPI00079B62FD|nr:UDP-glucose 4-epimerase GalE [Streptococcus sp. DD12]KXT76963.1 UDP-glucose 4-epimerase [Streptococcus sp. DD12]
MAILVLGGAGYIGSHMVDYLLTQTDQSVVVVDNLSTGHREALPEDLPFYQADMADQKAMRHVFEQHPDVDAVMHFAASSLVAESMAKPLAYFDNNLVGLVKFLEVMKDYPVKDLIFSSTAAVYGLPDANPITEERQKTPINPYGESKLMMEKVMAWAETAYGIRHVALRYFNVAGAKPDGSIGEDHRCETHLVPIILQVAQGQRPEVAIFGQDYATPDGTNIRDYVHPVDLAQAHWLALGYLKEGGASTAFNLGSSTGFSNLEILEAARRVTGQAIPACLAERRPGDPDTLIACSQKARQTLGWRPQYDTIDAMIQSAWAWHKSHPQGYASKPSPF